MASALSYLRIEAAATERAVERRQADIVRLTRNLDPPGYVPATTADREQIERQFAEFEAICRRAKAEPLPYPTGVPFSISRGVTGP